MSRKVERLGERLDALDGQHGPLPGWMRGMECLFGKAVVYDLLRMAWLEIKLGVTPETVNSLEREKHLTGPDACTGPDRDLVREAIADREWFMQHGKVEDALRRLCGLEGEITLESLERRGAEVRLAYEKQSAELHAQKPKHPPDSQLEGSTRD